MRFGGAGSEDEGTGDVATAYYDLLSRIHRTVVPRTYAEIGLRDGYSLSLAVPGTTIVGVDPAFHIQHPVDRSARCFALTSDEFFATHDLSDLFDGRPVDLAFIDGMHRFEFALRDFANLERSASSDTTILIHDCNPPTREVASRDELPGTWAGDVWKLIVALRRERPDLDVTVVDAAPTGLAIVRNLDPTSTTLFDRYDEIVSTYGTLDYSVIEDDRTTQLNLVPNEWHQVRTLLPDGPLRPDADRLVRRHARQFERSRSLRALLHRLIGDRTVRSLGRARRRVRGLMAARRFGGSEAPEPTGEDLVQRYQRNFGMPAEAPLTEAEVRQHWELEQRLRRELLASTPADRAEVFERSYSELYRELPWLNELAGQGAPPTSPDVTYRHWLALIGAPPRQVYEIGSGKAELITYLAACGYECTATEITSERGARWSGPSHPNLRWASSDGVRLDQFEAPGRYDVVISNQVIEHLHPDDVPAHLAAVREILRPDGRYILTTPHECAGPSDVSRVFGSDSLRGMHLKEYRYAELTAMLEAAGFRTIAAPMRLPLRLRRALGNRVSFGPSRRYLRYLLVVERVIGRLPRPDQRRRAARGARLLLFPNDLALVAAK